MSNFHRPSSVIVSSTPASSAGNFFSHCHGRQGIHFRQLSKGNDVGTQYRSSIYYHTPEQEAVAKASLKAMENKSGKKIATEVLPAKTFYTAEDYHQQYLEKGVGGRGKQSARKMCNDPIRCYG